jgi:hypothetical protein
MQWCLSNLQQLAILVGNRPFVNFCGVYNPTMADLNLLQLLQLNTGLEGD